MALALLDAFNLYTGDLKSRIEMALIIQSTDNIVSATYFFDAESVDKVKANVRILEDPAYREQIGLLVIKVLNNSGYLDSLPVSDAEILGDTTVALGALTKIVTALK